MTQLQDYELKIKRLETQLVRLQTHLDNESQTRIHAETALGKAEEQLALALDAARLATWQWNLSLRTINFNPRWSEMVDGVAIATDLADREWMAKIHPDDLPQLQHTLTQVAAKKRTRFVAQFRYKSFANTQKSWAWIEMIGVMQKSSVDQSHKLLIGCASDITTRKERVDELKQERDKAEQASQAKTEFLAHVSHELRTPLHAVLSMAEMIQVGASNTLAPKQTEQLGFLRQSAEHVLSLVNDLLDYASFERHQASIQGVAFEPNFEPVNVWQWTKGLSEPFKQKAQVQGLTFDVRLDIPKTQYLLLDMRRCTQVVNNLLGNAFKFTPKGTVSFTVSMQQQKLKIVVTDSGIGIEKDKLSSIFKPFTQADQGIQRQYGGTGLGLSICQTICQTLGGDIGIESKVGFGSVFTVTLPANAAVLEQQPTADKALKAVPQGLRVLVVDDNAINLKVAQAYGQQLGAQVTCCDSPIQAQTLLLSQPFDVALIDLQMPHMSGFELINAFQTQRQNNVINKYKAPKLVAATAHAMPGYEQTCLDAGFDGFLSKPFNATQLQKILTQWTEVEAMQTKPLQQQFNDDKGTPIFDDMLAKTFVSRFGFDRGLMQDICVAIAQDAPKRVKIMQQACHSQQFQELKRQAHALKGAFSQVGDTVVSALAAQIEAAPEQCQPEQIERLHAGIEASIQAITKACSAAPVNSN